MDDNEIVMAHINRPPYYNDPNTESSYYFAKHLDGHVNEMGRILDRLLKEGQPHKRSWSWSWKGRKLNAQEERRPETG